MGTGFKALWIKMDNGKEERGTLDTRGVKALNGHDYFLIILIDL